MDYAGNDERLRARIPGTSALAAEVPFAVRAEMATTLADIYLRRTMLGVRGDLGLDALDTVAGLARDTLGWDAARADADAYRDQVTRYHPGRAATADAAARPH